MIDQIGENVDAHIPHTQTAFRGGRSTTEQVFTVKIIAEQGITTPRYSVAMLMMDIIKVFESIHRAIIISVRVGEDMGSHFRQTLEHQRDTVLAQHSLRYIPRNRYQGK